MSEYYKMPCDVFDNVEFITREDVKLLIFKRLCEWLDIVDFKPYFKGIYSYNDFSYSIHLIFNDKRYDKVISLDDLRYPQAPVKHAVDDLFLQIIKDLIK